MEEDGEVQGKRKQTRALRKAARRAVRPHTHSHPFELRRKAVQLCLEEGFPVKQVARELGVGFSTLGAWVRRYRAQGEAGLQGKARPRQPAAPGGRRGEAAGRRAEAAPSRLRGSRRSASSCGACCSCP